MKYLSKEIWKEGRNQVREREKDNEERQKAFQGKVFLFEEWRNIWNGNENKVMENRKGRGNRKRE